MNQIHFLMITLSILSINAELQPMEKKPEKYFVNTWPSSGYPDLKYEDKLSLGIELFHALDEGNESHASELIQRGASVWVVDESGSTALFHAMKSEKLTLIEKCMLVRQLLARDANIFHINNANEYPRMLLKPYHLEALDLYGSGTVSFYEKRELEKESTRLQIFEQFETRGMFEVVEQLNLRYGYKQ